MKLIDQIVRYISAFESKNIDELQKMFGAEIKLRDWAINVEGLEQVIAEISKIFLTYEKIMISVINLYEKEITVITELEIFLDDLKLDVVDIIEFNDELKIVDIRAFKR